MMNPLFTNYDEMIIASAMLCYDLGGNYSKEYREKMGIKETNFSEATEVADKYVPDEKILEKRDDVYGLFFDYLEDVRKSDE